MNELILIIWLSKYFPWQNQWWGNVVIKAFYQSCWVYCQNEQWMIFLKDMSMSVALNNIQSVDRGEDEKVSLCTCTFFEGQDFNSHQIT